MGEYNEEALANCDFADYIEEEDSEYVYNPNSMLAYSVSPYSPRYYFWGRVDVMPEMTNTINLLKELGYKLPER